jgi:hypothetical protein
MTDYEEMVPLGTYLVRCMAEKPGVHFADKKMAANMIACSIANRIRQGKLERDKALLAARGAEVEEEKERTRLTVGKRTVSDLEAELKKVSDALVDVLDGESEHDIHAQTGLPKERCNEIHAIYKQLLPKTGG